MKRLLMILLGIFAIIAIISWLYRGYANSSSVKGSVSIPTVNVDTASGSTESGYVDIHGSAIMDDSGGTPAVPFVLFSDSKNHPQTKQLIFANSRGCLPNAGDIPCVPTYPSQSAYPDLKTGQKIRVQGYVREDRLLVTSLTRE